MAIQIWQAAFHPYVTSFKCDLENQCCYSVVLCLGEMVSDPNP